MRIASYREFHFLVFLFDVEGPPALDAALLEDVDHGHSAVSLKHVQGAHLGVLGPPREPVQVQGDGS